MTILTIPYQSSNGIPNYAAAMSKPVNTDNTAETDGYVLANWTSVSGTSSQLLINGVMMATVGNNFSGSADWAGFFITKGTTYRANGGSLRFFPLVGA